jgi:hypothetical protein
VRVTAAAGGSVSIRADGPITLESKTSVTLAAPSVVSSEVPV